MIKSTVRTTARLAAARTLVATRAVGSNAGKSLGLQLAEKPETKGGSWAPASTTESEITRKVISLTQDLQRAKPPIAVEKHYLTKTTESRLHGPFDYSMTKLAMDNKEQFRKFDFYKNYTHGRDDPFDKAGIDPLDLYTMPEVLSKFVSPMGQVYPRERTGCSSRNQKRLGMAIKRAIAAGLMSSTHRAAREMPRRLM